MTPTSDATARIRSRSWRGSGCLNRLATIQVIVRVDRAAATLGAQNITLTTMRAE